MTVEKVVEYETVENEVERIACDQCGGHTDLDDAGDWGEYYYRGPREEVDPDPWATANRIQRTAHFCPGCNEAFHEKVGWNEGERIAAGTRERFARIRDGAPDEHIWLAVLNCLLATGVTLTIALALTEAGVESVSGPAFAAIYVVVYLSMLLGIEVAYHDGYSDGERGL